MMWQKIETAPRNGTEIIGIFVRDYDGRGELTVHGPWTVAFIRGVWMASWDDRRVIESETDFGVEYKTPDIDPTHWMPLPSPPEAE